MADITITIDGEESSIIDERHQEMLDEMIESMGEEMVRQEYQKLLQSSIYQTRYGSQNGDIS